MEGCIATFPGCTDSASRDYVPDANTDDDDTCKYQNFGCSDGNALNYDSVATVSEGCVARVEGTVHRFVCQELRGRRQRGRQRRVHLRNSRLHGARGE